MRVLPFSECKQNASIDRFVWQCALFPIQALPTSDFILGALTLTRISAYDRHEMGHFRYVCKIKFDSRFAKYINFQLKLHFIFSRVVRARRIIRL